jgi:hypothetical protein
LKLPWNYFVLAFSHKEFPTAGIKINFCKAASNVFRINCPIEPWMSDNSPEDVYG